MYSYEDRVRAAELYIKLGQRIRATIRQLGDPTKKSWIGSVLSRQVELCPVAAFPGNKSTSDRHMKYPFHRIRIWTFAFTVAAAMTACGGGTGNGPSFLLPSGNPTHSNDLPLEGRYKAEIRRTTMGVPHVKANNWLGLGYGYGYAQAEDNLCTMADSFLTYRGERSRYFGADAPSLTSSTIGQPKNIDSDFFHKHVIPATAIEKMVAQQPDNMKQLVQGFTAGYNSYVRDIKAGGSGHAACRTQAWVQSITTDDVYRRMYSTNLAAGYDNFLTNIANAVAPQAASSAMSGARIDRTAAWQLAAGGWRMPELHVGGHKGIGSNAIGFGTGATGDASPLLLGNPHWFWRGPDRLYQAQLTIPGELDVSGASFLGLPVIVIGFNDNIAWSHTVSTARRFGFYELKLAAGDPTSYMRDGNAVKMQAHEITVGVKQADGSVSPVTRTLYRSVYGPMLDLSAMSPALAWSQTTAFAIRDINEENYRSFRNWLGWGQAKSLDEFVAIQRKESAIPWVNTVAVGRGSAKAWYADIGTVPNVSTEQVANCTTPSGAAINASLPRVPIFDGSRSACDWKTDADSVQQGAIGPSRLPSMVRDDYVANMNDSYWLVNPKVPMTGYPAIMGPAGMEPISFRTRLGNLMAQGRIDGTDGHGPKGATVDTVKRMALDSRVYTAELFKRQALKMVCGTPTIRVKADPQDGSPMERDIDTRSACTVLRVWDNTGASGARGAHLWDEFWGRAALVAPDMLYRVPFSTSDPIHTPRDLKAGAAQALKQAFGAAIARVQASGYALDAQRGDYLFVTRRGQKIPLYGGCNELGYFTVACSASRLDQGGYNMDGHSISNSYMQIVRFPEGGVEAYTFLTFSLSDDPASAHNADYTRAYSAQQWLKVPFSESEIKADAVYNTVIVGE